jgi:ParB/RepB/Spo0J family partition protein
MTPSFQRVPLTDIELDDDTFCITYRPDLRLLQQSVACVGVLSPVQLRHVAEAGHLQIVCGFKRLQACRQAGHSEVPALVYEAAELSEAQAFLLSVYDNLGCRTLNVVEKGRILQRLRDTFHYAETELVQEWCRRLDLPPRAETLAAYCTLVTLEDVLQAAAVEGALPLETTLWIGRHAAADRQALLALFTGLKLGSNRARELTALIDDLCLRDRCTAATVLQRLDLLAILAEAQLSGPQKTERVRRVLHEARYPLLSAHEHQFRDALRRLRLPSQISLRPPPYFEGPQVQVTFGFRSRQELQQLAQRLLEAAADTALDDLVALL